MSIFLSLCDTHNERSSEKPFMVCTWLCLSVRRNLYTIFLHDFSLHRLVLLHDSLVQDSFYLGINHVYNTRMEGRYNKTKDTHDVH